MNNDCHKNDKTEFKASLPRRAMRSINRCNLPASILGGLHFQKYPSPLSIDSVALLHKELFDHLDQISDAGNRAQHFIDYMVVHFRLHLLEEIGFDSHLRVDRSKANYQRLIRGWAFNPDGIEAAIIKGWVESRFGLLPQFHEHEINSIEDESYANYLHQYSQGLYNTNALEAQLDLIFSYCQYELHRQDSESHLTLYRGSNQIQRLNDSVECAKPLDAILLNNINSFSLDIERASEFGDLVIKVSVPKEKVFFYSNLLPGCLKGEDEVMVLGGVYCAQKVL